MIVNELSPSSSPSKEYHNFFQFPVLVGSKGSLTPLEKSILGHFIILNRPRVILELGVFQAVTIKFMCEVMAISQIEGKVFGFDLPDMIAQLRETDEKVRDFEQTSRLQLIPGSLPETLIDWLENAQTDVDLVLIDAVHSYGSVIEELTLVWPKISSNGYILCHDYCPRFEGVRYAVDRFATTHDAMVLPFLPSTRGKEAGAGFDSSLVVLCRRPYPFKFMGWVKHVGERQKEIVLRYPKVKAIWLKLRKYIKKN